MTRFEFDKNDAPDLEVTVRHKNGSAYDLTSATLHFQVRETPQSAVALCSLSTGSGITHTAPLAGEAVIAVPASTTAGLTPPTTLVWSLELEANTRRRVIAKGKIDVRPEVTQ